MTKKNKYRQSRKRIRKKEIIYLLLSVILFIVNCLCSFHVMTFITVGAELVLFRQNQQKEKININFFSTFSMRDTNQTEDLNADNLEVSEIYIEYTAETTDEPDIAGLCETFEDDENYDYVNVPDEDDKWRYKLSESEIKLVAAVAMLEDINAMEAISEVILNRIESDKFEETTVEGIIYAKGQFYVAERANNITANEEAVEAALAVFRDGVSVVGGAKFFAEKSVKPEKIARGLYLIASIGDTNFYGQK